MLRTECQALAKKIFDENYKQKGKHAKKLARNAERIEHGEMWRQRVMDIERMMPEMESLCRDRLLGFVANKIIANKHGEHVWHFMFNDSDDRRVLEWWPSSGKYWCRIDGERGTELDSTTILIIASRCAGKPSSNI
jgi:hypothetical protein